MTWHSRRILFAGIVDNTVLMSLQSGHQLLPFASACPMYRINRGAAGCSFFAAVIAAKCAFIGEAGMTMDCPWKVEVDKKETGVSALALPVVVVCFVVVVVAAAAASAFCRSLLIHARVSSHPPTYWSLLIHTNGDEVCSAAVRPEN